jgi:hypothetical protein
MKAPLLLVAGLALAVSSNAPAHAGKRSDACNEKYLAARYVGAVPHNQTLQLHRMHGDVQETGLERQ